MPVVLPHGWRPERLAGPVAWMCTAAVALTLALGSAAAPAAAQEPAISVQVSSVPVGQPMKPGFVGLSMEYSAVHEYTGRDPAHPNPVLVALLRQLAPQGGLVLRIGGDSTDDTWWPMPGVIPPAGIDYGLTPGWMRTTRGLAAALGARLILGVNLAARRPALAAAEGRALLAGIGRSHIAALEIGNEPDLYTVFPWYRDRRGHIVHTRSSHYSFKAFAAEFAHWRAALPTLPLAGPTLSGLRWMPNLAHFLATQPRVGVVTFHRYPLRACVSNPSDPTYASIPNLLEDSSSAGLAAQVAPYVKVAHAHGLPFRLDELNSAACRGRAGVSDAFASALWVLDTLFNVASVGVDAVNLHTLPGAPYEPVTYIPEPDGWHAFVRPIFYGALAFDRAFPPGAELLHVSAPAGPVKVWATRDTGGHTHVVVINQQADTPVTVTLALPSDSAPLAAQALTAPGLSATSGVTLDGQSFGSDTTTGTLTGAPSGSEVLPGPGGYQLQVPAASGMLLTQ